MPSSIQIIYAAQSMSYRVGALSPARHALARPIEEGRLFAPPGASDDPLKARHEARFPVMVPADFGDQLLPLTIESGPLVTDLRFLEVRQSLMIYLLLPAPMIRMHKARKTFAAIAGWELASRSAAGSVT